MARRSPRSGLLSMRPAPRPTKTSTTTRIFGLTLCVSQADLDAIANDRQRATSNRWTSRRGDQPTRTYAPWLRGLVARRSSPPAALRPGRGRRRACPLRRRRQVEAARRSSTGCSGPSGDTSASAARVSFPEGAQKLQKPVHRQAGASLPAKRGSRPMATRATGSAEGRQARRRSSSTRSDKSLLPTLSGSKAYEKQRSVQAEMLSAINERKTVVLAARGRNARASNRNSRRARRPSKSRVRAPAQGLRPLRSDAQSRRLKEVRRADRRSPGDPRPTTFADARGADPPAQRPLRGAGSATSRNAPRSARRSAGRRVNYDPLPTGPVPASRS